MFERKVSNEATLNNGHFHNVSSPRRMAIAITLNAVIFVVELAGGLLTNSLALISDAVHNLSDVFALVLSFIASKVVLWKSNAQKSYGYVRVEIFVAFLNSLTLVGIGAYIVYEGIRRYFSPQPILGSWMVVVAIIGFVVNTVSTLLLRKDAHKDLNLRSAYLHLLSDAIESLAVLAVGFAIYWRAWFILDPIVSVGIGAFIIRSGWNVLGEAVHVLTEGTPRGIDLDEVADFLRSIPEIVNVHHLHIWSLSSQFRALSAHLVVSDRSISEGRMITDKVEKALFEKYRIDHPTLQLECEICKEQGTLVDMHHSAPRT